MKHRAARIAVSIGLAYAVVLQLFLATSLHASAPRSAGVICFGAQAPTSRSATAPDADHGAVLPHCPDCVVRWAIVPLPTAPESSVQRVALRLHYDAPAARQVDGATSWRTKQARAPPLLA